MKPNRLIPLILIIFYTTLFAGYGYNTSPSSSGIVQYKAFNRSDNSLKTSKNISENTSIANLSFGSISNGDLTLSVSIASKYALKHPTLLLLDSNGKRLTYKQYSDNSTYLSWTILGHTITP